MFTRRGMLALAVGIGLALAAGARADADTSEEPFFADLSGKTVRPSDHAGHVVVLHFWATWCGPCATEMPIFVRLHDELASKGVRVIAASANSRDEAELVRAYMRKHGMQFTTWLWVSAKDMRHYGVGPGLPATVVIDRHGKVRHAAKGLADEAALRKIVDGLVAETPPER